MGERERREGERGREGRGVREGGEERGRGEMERREGGRESPDGWERGREGGTEGKSIGCETPLKPILCIIGVMR